MSPEGLEACRKYLAAYIEPSPRHALAQIMSLVAPLCVLFFSMSLIVFLFGRLDDVYMGIAFWVAVALALASRSLSYWLLWKRKERRAKDVPYEQYPVLKKAPLAAEGACLTLLCPEE
ncbi:MAG: hypothetical protein AAB947_01060 [Patescibacteria group bacterium]